MRRITSRFVMLIASAAVAPLVIYGAVSISNLGEGTRESVDTGNQRVADQIAQRLKLYVDSNARILRSVGEELSDTNLAHWQQSRILKNHVLEFPEFREISLFDASGRVIATSRIGPPETKLPSTSGHGTQGVEVAPIFQDDDNLPTTDLSLRLGSGPEVSAWLVARISLEELWRFVDKVRVGQRGYALVLSEDPQSGYRIVAHGNPEEKRLVALPVDPGEQLPEVRMLLQHRAEEQTFTDSYVDPDGREQLAAVARIADINWTVIVEQPTEEAYEITVDLQRQLFVAIGLALLGTIVLGWVWARSFITRIFALKHATQAIAEGRMDERVAISGRDEIRQLGDSFNSMADRLVELQEDVRKQERQAMFGRIAAGPGSRPVASDSEHRQQLQADREDVRRLRVPRDVQTHGRARDGDHQARARRPPQHRPADSARAVPVEINRSVGEAVESMQQHAETAGVTLRDELSDEPVFIEGDVFALGRVYRNLILNAIQATAPGGIIVVGSEGAGDRVQVRIHDTGCGIPPERISAIFEDFVTTKRRGLGLGLAISRKIVEQLGGQISVASEVGKGTTFVLDFPRTRPRPMLVAG